MYNDKNEICFVFFVKIGERCMEQKDRENRSLFLFPKTTVFLLVLFVFGFFLLLGIVLRGKNSTISTLVSQKENQTSLSGSQPLSFSSQIKLQPVTEEDWIRGDKNAPVSVIEFSDLECPFCKRFHPTMKQVIEEYPGKVKWVYRHFPITSIHPKALKEAEAAECAGELGGNEGFWKYVDLIFEITPSNNNLNLSLLPVIAERIGLDRDAFDACLSSGRYTQKVQDHYNQAIEAGGTGTPYSVIVTSDGRKIPIAGAFPFAQMKAILDPLVRGQGKE